MILPPWPSQYPSSCIPNSAAWGKHSASPVICRHHCPSGDNTIPSVPGQLGDFPKGARSAARLKAARSRAGAAARAQGHSTVKSSHTSHLLYKPLLEGLARPRPGSEAGWLFPSRSRSRGQQPCVPQLQASEIPVLGKDRLPVPINASRRASACPHESLGDVPATFCPSVAHAMPDTD